MKNMDSIISGHNYNILIPKQKSFGCNCRKKDSCHLNCKCLTPKVIYRANISDEANNDQKFYFGLAETRSAITIINKISNISNFSIPYLFERALMLKRAPPSN